MQEYMLRKGSCALIMNNRNEFLLVNLEAFDEKNFAIPGGGQDKNETFIECAYREIKEELNIEKEDLEYVCESNNPIIFYFKTPQVKEGIEYVGSEKHYFGFRFIGDESKITPTLGEVRCYKWVKYEDLKDYLLFGQQLENTEVIIREIFKSFDSSSEKMCG